jgi:hypothetical protein
VFFSYFAPYKSGGCLHTALYRRSSVHAASETSRQRAPRAATFQRGAGGPGADDDPLFDPEEPFDGSFPGADDDPFFDAVLCVAARLLEPPAPISATVARTASDRDALLIGVLLVGDLRAARIASRSRRFWYSRERQPLSTKSSTPSYDASVAARRRASRRA